MLRKTLLYLLLFFCGSLNAATISVGDEPLLLYRSAISSSGLTHSELIVGCMNEDIEFMMGFLVPCVEMNKFQEYQRRRLSDRLIKNTDIAHEKKVALFIEYNKINVGYAHYMECLFLLEQMKLEMVRFNTETGVLGKKCSAINFLNMKHLFSSQVNYLYMSFRNNVYINLAYSNIDYREYFHLAVENSGSPLMMMSILLFSED